MQDYEKLGAFYLGRLYDDETRRVTEQPLLYDAKDLTTHAVIVGMTGSGKTGLGVALIEEAALDGIPTLVVDPKGDMGNLLLAFPELRGRDFLPWVSPEEATRSGQTPEQLAESTAALWRRGLAEWGQEPERIGRYRDAADVAIYTPGGSAGLQLRALQSFSAPPAALRSDAEALTERVDAAVAGLLALLGETADPVSSREHVLLANLFHVAWREGRDLDLPTLVRQIVRPPFEQLGVLDLETFFPASERQTLALKLNALLASPSFAPWLAGEALDVGRLLYTPEGRPRIAICSLAHLSDEQRMFFVTLLLSEVVTWMRSQPGTGSLRALLYMDEIFGFFPPTAVPPSKPPMLTLLKQARAYGLGVILATQNPADLDYKGLANCGTWFVGRLQTERDRERLLDGLQGFASGAGGGWNRGDLGRLMGGLGKRVFLMSNAHEDEAVLFHTRWVLSYLSGPLAREQIERLMGPRKEGESVEEKPPTETIRAEVAKAQSVQPSPAAEISVAFLPPMPAAGGGGESIELVYRPALYGRAQLHFKRASLGVDDWREVTALSVIDPGARSLDWSGIQFLAQAPVPARSLQGDGRFSPLAPAAQRAAAWTAARKRLATLLYQEQSYTVFQHPELKEVSKPGEREGEFRIRVSRLLAENRDREVEKVKQRYGSRLATVRERIRSYEERLEREQSQYRDRKLQTAISFGSTLMGALMGRKVGSVRNVGRATTAMRDVSRTRRESQDVERAEARLEEQREKLRELEEAFASDLEELRERFSSDDVQLRAIELRPLKSDIVIEDLMLVWTPWRVEQGGVATAAWAVPSGTVA